MTMVGALSSGRAPGGAVPIVALSADSARSSWVLGKRREDRDCRTRNIRPQNRTLGTQRPPPAHPQHPDHRTYTEDSMASRPAAPPPHPLVEQVDWDAIQ